MTSALLLVVRTMLGMSTARAQNRVTSRAPMHRAKRRRALTRWGINAGSIECGAPGILGANGRWLNVPVSRLIRRRVTAVDRRT